MKILFTIGIFILLIVGFFHPINALNQDLGRHLITGKIILENHSVPKINLYSYTFPDFQFINHHWLSEIFFYLLFQFGGLQTLFAVTLLIVSVAFGLVYFSLNKQASITALIISSILYLRILFERTDIRPEIFSYLFLALFIFILYKFQTKFTRLIFILPFIELLWVNIHIYFPIGIVVLALFTLDGVINHRKNLNHQYTSILVVILILSSLSTLINPNTVSGALYPFTVLNSYGYSIEENQNIFFLWNIFHKQTILYFGITVVAGIFLLLAKVKQTKPIDWLLFIFFSLSAIFAERNLPLFVFGTFITFSNNLSLVFDKLNFLNKNKLIVFTALGILLIWQIISVSNIRSVGYGVNEDAKQAVDFLINKNIKGPLFNNFDIGSYLIYRLYPKEKVFIDGRPEAYPLDFFQKTYIPMQQDPSVFEKTDKQHAFNAIFFNHTDQTPWAEQFVKQIVVNTNWKIVYLDDFVIILVKNIEENKNLPLITKGTFHIQTSDLNKLYRYAHFFNSIRWQDQELEAYEKILTLNPNFCIGLYNAAIILNQKQSPVANSYANRFEANCR